MKENGAGGLFGRVVRRDRLSLRLVGAALPLWGELRAFAPMRRAMAGINAAVVGILLAALYHPVWPSAILNPEDFVLALGAFAALMFWKWPPWLVVVLTGGIGALMVQF